MSHHVAAVTLAYTPSLDPSSRPTVEAAASPPAATTAVGYLLTTDGPVPADLGLDRDALAAAGFSGAAGSTLAVPAVSGPVRIAVGTGPAAAVDGAMIRDVAAAFARAAGSHENVALFVDSAGSLATAKAAQAATEGALLARYQYDVLRSKPSGTALRQLTIVSATDPDAARDGTQRGLALASATGLARDLANTPHSHLNATRLGEIATALGREHGFAVEVWDKDRLIAEGIGGILGVNAGSAQPPCLIKLSYSPAGATGRLAMVGKGIMYDSGGIALKPGDAVHAAMKNDMSGAAAILAAVTTMARIGSRTAVTGYLCCTDSMPSGTAMALGDVITIRGGTTVEVVNTDAEGRLVMADGLVLAVEDKHDAVIDIATLTGATMRALGTEVASVFGNDQSLVDQVRAAGAETDEPVWQLPLVQTYNKQLSSTVADMKNLGYGEGGAITAALFLERFVDGLPWAHIDIAGVAQSTDGRPWHTAGCTGFGARLLVELAEDFKPKGA